MDSAVYVVPGMTCSHCAAAVREEILVVSGVHSVTVDLETKHVVVTGQEVDGAAIRAAIEEAGYDAL